jgi:hypothetical protein
MALAVDFLLILIKILLTTEETKLHKASLLHFLETTLYMFPIVNIKKF